MIRNAPPTTGAMRTRCGQTNIRNSDKPVHIQADVAVVDGAIGFYDGMDGLGAIGSTSEMAKWLAAPIVLVLDVSVLCTGSRYVRAET
jgi:cobyrinic acid a,c-diamide synthase